MQEKALKETFFLIHFIFQRNFGPKMSHQKLKKFTQGVGGGQKSATYYLNYTLRSVIKNLNCTGVNLVYETAFLQSTPDATRQSFFSG
jgi:hypothetical protein